MDTILNVPEVATPNPIPGLPGDLRPPPMARFAASAPPPSFPEVTKPIAAEQPKRCGCLKWAILFALALLLITLSSFLLMKPLDMPILMNGDTAEDPLNDLLKVFIGQGVEPSDALCLACFFSDPGRVRKAQGTNDAFIVYKTDNAINFFEVVTHVFNPPADFPATFAPAPFLFWTSADADSDGQPDGWEPLPAQYRKMGSVLGWEKGAFFNAVPAHPFFKISFRDMEGSWRPQVGNVLLVPQVEGPAGITMPMADVVGAAEDGEEVETDDEAADLASDFEPLGSDVELEDDAPEVDEPVANAAPVPPPMLVNQNVA